MKVIIFLAILGLSLAGLRGVDKKKPVPHWMPHHHHHASKASGHGHAHSNSENSEELFSLTGAIQDGIASVIQDTTNAITTDIQNNADNVSNLLQETADTICDYTQGAACNLTQQIADNISQSVQNNAATIDPLINATGSDLAYATQNINTTQVDQDIDDGVALAGTALKTAGDVMQVVNAGLSIAADVAFVGTNGLIGATNSTNNPLMNAIQDTIDTIESDIQGTLQTLQIDYNDTVQTLQNDYTDAVNSITSAIESINGTEISQTTNDIASAIGTGLKLTNSALQDANDGLSIANSVIP